MINLISNQSNLNKNIMEIVTFVITTRNRHFSLRKIVNEIKNLNIQIIIIDDNSKYKESVSNRRLCLNIGNLKYIYLKKNMGQPYASNIGMKLCKTKYIWFFDDDDFVKKTDVIKIIYYLNKINLKGLLLPMRPIFEDKVLKRIYPTKNEHSFKFLLTRSQKVNTSCSIFNLKEIKKIGGWDQNLVSGKDTDLFLRFARLNNFSIYNNVEVFVDYSSPLRTTNDYIKQLKGKIQFLKKHWKILSLKKILIIILTLLSFYPLFYNIKLRIKKFCFNTI